MSTNDGSLRVFSAQGTRGRCASHLALAFFIVWEVWLRFDVGRSSRRKSRSTPRYERLPDPDEAYAIDAGRV
jgi:hypothetical protein